MIWCLFKAITVDALRSLKRPGVWLLLLITSVTFLLLGRCSKRKQPGVVVDTFEEVVSSSQEVINSNDEFLEKEY